MVLWFTLSLTFTSHCFTWHIPPAFSHLSTTSLTQSPLKTLLQSGHFQVYSCLSFSPPLLVSSLLSTPVCVFILKTKQPGWANLIWCRKHISGPWPKQLDRKWASNLSWWEGQPSWNTNKQQQRGGSLVKNSDWLFLTFICMCPITWPTDKATKLYMTNT